MSIIQRLRQFVFRNTLNKKLSSARKPSGKKVSFETAKTIGLLFDANDLNTRNIVLKYGASLKKQGKRVTWLGFLDNKHDTENYTFDYYNLKNIDWAQRAKGEHVDEFVNQPFDILIAAMLKSSQHAEFIAATSKASIKAGPIPDYVPEAFDVMIDYKTGTDLPEFLKQIESLLRKTQASAQSIVV
jgi:hypothetical protein